MPVYLVEHVFRVGGRDAEACPRLDDGRRRKAHDHHADVPPQHLPAKRSGGTDKAKGLNKENDSVLADTGVKREKAFMVHRLLWPHSVEHRALITVFGPFGFCRL